MDHGPLPRRPVDGEGGPPAAVFVAEVDQQRVSAVLDAQAMPRIGLFMQPSVPPCRLCSCSATKEVHRWRPGGRAGLTLAADWRDTGPPCGLPGLRHRLHPVTCAARFPAASAKEILSRRSPPTTGRTGGLCEHCRRWPYTQSEGRGTSFADFVLSPSRRQAPPKPAGRSPDPALLRPPGPPGRAPGPGRAPARDPRPGLERRGRLGRRPEPGDPHVAPRAWRRAPRAPLHPHRFAPRLPFRLH